MDLSEDELLFEESLVAPVTALSRSTGLAKQPSTDRQQPLDASNEFLKSVLIPPVIGNGGAPLLPTPKPQKLKGRVDNNGMPRQSETKDRQWIVARIENIFEQQLDAVVSKDRELSIEVKMRPSASQETNSIRRFNFPGKSEKDAWRFTVIIRILELIHQALVSERVISKRDIFYHDVALFSKKTVVDRFVDDLAYTFGVPRAMLHVTAAAKGLMAGNFVIRTNDGSTIDGRSNQEGTLISPLKNGDVFDTGNTKWVLVVEKEATFRAILSSRFWEALCRGGILVTGKGYPDITTRSMLHSIAKPSNRNKSQSPTILALVDYDPDGLAILSSYKHGSIALSHEKAHLTLPSVQWLGLSSQSLGTHQDLHQSQGLLSLSSRDRHKANSMLTREPFVECGLEPEWRRELQVMLFLNIKAEIQILDARDGGIAAWLEWCGLE